MQPEIELKLRVAMASISRLRRSRLIRSWSIAPAVAQKLYTVYYDTEDHDLSRNDIALRLRRDGKQWVQTIKGGGGATAGLHHRYEWEVPVKEAQPDFTKISDPNLISLFNSANLREKLRPIFTTEFSRSTRMLRLLDGEVEFCLDRGRITAGEISVPISEIELELKSGGTASLFQLALDLLAIVPLRLENRSKAERGYALVDGCESPPRKATPVLLYAEMSLSDAFNAITASCLNHLLSNEPGMLEGRDIEYPHQMRVAVRRQRSALSIFSLLFPAEFGGVAGELRWLIRQIGTARDWDVFVTETLHHISGVFSQHSGISRLHAQCEQLRLAHADVARDAVQSKRYTTIMLKLGTWISTEPGMPATGSFAPQCPATGVPEISLEIFAKKLLGRRHDKLRQYGKKKIKRLSSSELHHLRIAVKKQRYTIEFFAGLYASDRRQHYVKWLTSLQDVLGKINDLATMERLLGELPHLENDRGVCEARGILLGWAGCRAQEKKRELYRVWKSFNKTQPFW
jgi:triphosphatase